MEEADKKIDNDIVIDDALNNLLVLPDAKNEISNKDYVVSREESKSSRTVTQFIGDNIDINITSIHGNTPFHSMGLIKVTSPTLTLSDPQGTEVVHRLQMKAHDKFKILKKAEVKILPFSNRKNSGLNTITFVPIDELSTSMMQDKPLLTSGDTLWAAGWLIKAQDSQFTHANWNGWMKSIHADHIKQSTQIDFLPVIEGDPNDYSTIFTTLKECVKLSGNSVTIVTFDFPIWIKAVDIIKQTNIPVIPRLGGFHLLKSYLGSIDNIMADSGLLEIVQLIYPGSTTASHIMDGGCFAKAIGAHLLIDAAIYQHVMKHVFTGEELSEIRSTMEMVADKKLGARHTDPIVSLFKQRFEDTFKCLAEGGRTPALWVQYHYMVDVIKIFIRS